jgi:membrane protein DedA with SNARE-associated domain
VGVSLEAAGWYASIFFWLFFTGIGIPPCPEEAGIVYAASLTARPEVRWWFALPAASLGILCADVVLYGVGRFWGRRLFEYRWAQRLVKPERRQRFEARFHDHGIKVLITARFLPPLRTGVFIVAGAVRYSFLRFLIADGIYVVVGVPLFFFTGAGIVHVLRQAGGHWLVYLAAAAAGVYLLYRYYRHLRERELRIGAPVPVSVLEVQRSQPAVGPAANGPAGPKASQPASPEG